MDGKQITWRRHEFKITRTEEATGTSASGIGATVDAESIREEERDEERDE